MEAFQELARYFCCGDGSRGMKREGCRVSFEGFFRRKLIVDLDSCSAHGINQSTRCDYIIFAEFKKRNNDAVFLVSAVELTRQPFSVGKIIPQVAAGAVIAEDAVRSCLSIVSRSYADLKFFPIAFVGGGFPGSEKVKVEKQRGIRFRWNGADTEKVVQVSRCGRKLMDIDYSRALTAGQQGGRK